MNLSELKLAPFEEMKHQAPEKRAFSSLERKALQEGGVLVPRDRDQSGLTGQKVRDMGRNDPWIEGLCPPNSHVEVLTPKEKVFHGGVFRRCRVRGPPDVICMMRLMPL